MCTRCKQKVVETESMDLDLWVLLGRMMRVFRSGDVPIAKAECVNIYDAPHLQLKMSFQVRKDSNLSNEN